MLYTMVDKMLVKQELKAYNKFTRADKNSN